MNDGNVNCEGVEQTEKPFRVAEDNRGGGKKETERNPQGLIKRVGALGGFLEKTQEQGVPGEQESKKLLNKEGGRTNHQGKKQIEKGPSRTGPEPRVL